MPTRRELLAKSRKELNQLAKKQGLSKYSKLRKTDLVDALLSAAPGESAEDTPPLAGPAEAGPESNSIEPAATADLRPNAQVGAKYTIGDLPAADKSDEDEEEIDIPDHYGTREIVLTARDPRWFHVYWDFTDTQLEDGRRASSDGIHRLRLMDEEGVRRIVEEVALPPGARNWYFQANRPGGTYSARLGYLTKSDTFVEMGASNTATAPDEESPPSPPEEEEFVSIPVDEPFNAPPRTNEEPHSEPNIEVESSESNAPAEHSIDATPENVEDSRGDSSAESVHQEEDADAHRTSPPSDRIEIDPPPLSVRRRAPMSRAGTPVPRPPEGAKPRGNDAPTERAGESWDRAIGASWSRPLGASWERPLGASWAAAPGAPREFRMRVNAEVVIYGDTVPDARLLANGEEVPLDRKGRFSFHYHLPDGKYRLDLEATSADGNDTLAAQIALGRRTLTRGEVAEHPRSPDLPDPPKVPAES